MPAPNRKKKYAPKLRKKLIVIIMYPTLPFRVMVIVVYLFLAYNRAFAKDLYDTPYWTKNRTKIISE